MPPGSCAPDDCSLREAVIAANAAAGPDRIILGAGTYALTTVGNDDGAFAGDLDVTTVDRTEILGTGTSATVIDAAFLGDRAFDVLASGSLVLRDLSVRNASATGDGGAIRTAGLLITRAVAITDNTASGDGSGVYAAAGIVDLTDTVLSGNTAGGDAALKAVGATTTNLTRVGVTDNGSAPATSGSGGIENSGTMALVEGDVSRNTSGVNSSAGGIRNQAGTLTIERSTISGNSAPTSDSGGLFIPGGVVTMRSVTISGNQAANNGGGLRAQGTATVTLEGVTVAGNTSGSGGAVAALGDSRIFARGTIVGDNAGDHCQGAGIVSLGGNLGEGASCAAFTAPGDILGPEPRLGPLAANGRRTRTHALLAGSPALDSAGAACSDVDQRGIPRPLGAACDAGALEARPDLRLGFLDAGPPDLAPGVPTQITVRVANVGIGAAADGQLALAGSAGVEVLAANPSQGTCATTGTCALGLIAPGGEATVTVTVRAAAAGAASLTASASTTADQDPGNNAASAGFTVVAPVAPVTPTPAPAARPAVLALPRLTGAPRVGRNLRCVGARFAGARARSITWLRGNRRIARQTRATYRLRRADRGKVIACAVRATNQGGAVRVVSLGVFVRR